MWPRDSGSWSGGTDVSLQPAGRIWCVVQTAPPHTSLQKHGLELKPLIPLMGATSCSHHWAYCITAAHPAPPARASSSAPTGRNTPTNAVMCTESETKPSQGSTSLAALPHLRRTQPWGRAESRCHSIVLRGGRSQWDNRISPAMASRGTPRRGRAPLYPPRPATLESSWGRRAAFCQSLPSLIIDGRLGNAPRCCEPSGVGQSAGAAPPRSNEARWGSAPAPRFRSLLCDSGGLGVPARLSHPRASKCRRGAQTPRRARLRCTMAAAALRF